MGGILPGAGLVLLGYLLGSDGKPSRAMVVCPCGPDGQPVERLDGLFPQISLGQGLLPTPPSLIPVALEIEKEDIPFPDLPIPRDANTTYYLSKMVDTLKCMNVVFEITSTLNQAVTVQVVGHSGNSPDDAIGLVNIEAGQTLNAGSSAMTKLGLGIDLEVNWYPFLGLTIATGAAAPTAGRIGVRALVRRWGR